MKKFRIINICLLSIAIISSSFAATELDVHGLGVTFSGDHATGSPSPAVLNDDLGTAAKYFSYIRTYTTQHTGGKLDVLKYITNRSNLNILIGVPLNSTTDAQLNSIAANIKSNPQLKSRITGILIGNETGLSTVNQIKTYIDKAKKMFPGIPISSAQAWNFWVNDFFDSTGVTSKVDFIAINLYPNWCWGVAGPNKQPIADCWNPSSTYTPERAATSVAEGYIYLKMLNKKFPNKKMVITETGWPTTFGAYGSSDVSLGVSNSKKFITLINAWAKSSKTNVYMYSLFDDIYADPGNLFSTHFGYINSKNQQKFPLDKYSLDK